MSGRSGAAGHEPAAVARLERHAVVHHHRLGERATGGCRGAEVEKPWHAERVTRHVAAETLEVAAELRRLRPGLAARRLLVELVEDDALFRVVGGHLDHLAVPHPTERHAVVEEQRPRVCLADAFGLEAGAREHQHLRVHGDLQRVERRLQIPAAAVELQLDGAVLQLLVDVHYEVPERGGRVGNRRVVGRPQEHSAALGGHRAGHQHQDGQHGRGENRQGTQAHRGSIIGPL